LKRFSRPLVVKIRDKAEAGKGVRFANYVKAVLSILFTWGKERGRIAEDHPPVRQNLAHGNPGCSIVCKLRDPAWRRWGA
jgi:hypothetical protein